MGKKKTKIDLMDVPSEIDPKDGVSAGREEGESPVEANQKNRSGKPKRFILMAILLGSVILAGGIGAAGYLGYLPLPVRSSSHSADPIPPPKGEMGETLKFSPLIINLNEESGRHYLKTTIVLELDDKKWAEPIQTRMSVFIDTVILTVSAKKLDDLKMADFKERLKKELLAQFNEHLGQKGIRQIYFDEFLFQ